MCEAKLKGAHLNESKGGLYPRYGGFPSLDTLTIAIVCIFSSNLSIASQIRGNQKLYNERKQSF